MAMGSQPVSYLEQDLNRGSVQPGDTGEVGGQRHGAAPARGEQPAGEPFRSTGCDSTVHDGMAGEGDFSAK